MSATPDTNLEDIIPQLDKCETASEALELLMPDPDQSLRSGLARMATALALIGEESLTFEFGPVQLTVSNLELDGLIDGENPITET